MQQPLPATLAWHCTAPLASARYDALRRHMMLEGFKWDSQIGDAATLAPFALVLPSSVWAKLAEATETLTTELLAQEAELAQRPELWPTLGLPQKVRTALASDAPWTPAAARVMRFDFHPTAEGWRLSEVNSDVPGGYTESGYFTRLMADATGAGRPAGDPGAALTAALLRHIRTHGRIAFLSAAGYMEDQQIAAYLAAQLSARGVEAITITPEQLIWRDGVGHVAGARCDQPVDAIFRFYQGEWMTALADEHWRALFRGGRTPVCNPGTAILTESKRLPLLWSRLSAPADRWRQFLPETRPVTALLTRPAGDWVLKAAYSNTGDRVYSPAWSHRTDWLLASAAALARPHQWIAQHRFQTLALPTPIGPRHPCIGVYTIEGRAVGIYARLSPRPLVDFSATDVAVLLAD